jgi:hypothetical protein
MELVKGGMTIDDALEQAEWMALSDKDASASEGAAGPSADLGLVQSAAELATQLERVMTHLNLPEASRAAVRSMSPEQKCDMIMAHQKALAGGARVSPAGANVDKAGWLIKSPPLDAVDDMSVKRWQRRWFELQGATLVYWASDDKSEAQKGEIDLCDTTRLFREQPSTRHKYAFTIEVKGRPLEPGGTVGPPRTFFLKADTALERTAWTDKIAAAVARGTGGKAEVIASAPVPPVMRGVEQPPLLTADVDPDYCGFLVKSPKLAMVDELTPMRWQRRWFVLKGL